MPLETLFAGYPDRYVAVRDALAEHGYGPEAVQRLGELGATLHIRAARVRKPGRGRNLPETEI